MLPERWQQLTGVLETALDTPVDERENFLEAACGDDSDLRAEVEAYLSTAAAEPEDFFEGFAARDKIWTLLAERENAYFGRQIGKYKIVGELGAGGMGRVFLAERADGEFEQKVALKFLRQGLDTPSAVRRFALERQILAKLQHPNIAQLIDGGTTEDNVPYLVMEYVAGGLPIDEYCRRQSSSLEHRLDLFRTICAAVSFAHRNLIVHRDLKPDNILVTDDGTVKLLDFGIAKLLSADSSVKATQTRWQILTPEYASPEQIRGDAITTASDIYALGIVLYELLTGSRPFKFENGNPEEVIKVISQNEPVAPSRVLKNKFRITNYELRAKSDEQSTKDNGQWTKDETLKSKIQNLKSLNFDLDNIALKALKKEPERRYATVEQFSEDIRRYQRGLPVSARRDTWNYRAEKFVRRNRLSVAALFLVLLSLFAGIVVANYQAAEARRERALAERRFNDVRQLANSVLFEFYDAISETPGSTKVRRLMVERAREYLDQLAQEAQNDAALQRELATAYLRIGDVQGKPNNANLGDTDGALENYRKAVSILENLIAAEPSNVENRRDLTVALENIGRIESVSSDYAAALETHRRVLAMREALLADNPQNTDFRRLVADSYRLIGDAQGEILNMTEAENLLLPQLENYRKALAIQSELASPDSSDNLGRRMLAILHQRIGGVSNSLGEKSGNAEYFHEALEHHKRALQIWLENEPADTDGRFPAGEYKHIGNVEMNLGDIKGAMTDYARARIIFEKQAAGDANSAEYRRELAYLQIDTAEVLMKARNTTEAIKNYRQALQTFEQLTAADPTRVTDNYRIMTTGYESLGRLLEEKGETDEAVKNYRKALEIGKQWLKIAPDNIELNSRQTKLADKIRQ